MNNDTQSGRVIKFRGQKVNGGGWIFGSLVNTVYYEGCMYIIPEQMGRDGERQVPFEKVAVPVFPETVGEFIGLKDKLGWDIYDGDFIEKDGEVRQVFWDKRRPGFRFLSIQSKTRIFGGLELRLLESVACQEYLMAKMTVIGNIYSNPELLNNLK
jgi:YopX protein